MTYNVSAINVEDYVAFVHYLGHIEVPVQAIKFPPPVATKFWHDRLASLPWHKSSRLLCPRLPLSASHPQRHTAFHAKTVRTSVSK